MSALYCRGVDGEAPSESSGASDLYRRLLVGDERDRLQALKAATEANAPIYLAILGVFVAARERYEVELRTERIAEGLADTGVVVDDLEASLRQLELWGNVTWTQDTTRVARLEDFRRRRALWQLTAVGRATHDAVHSVLAAVEVSGSLQRSLFRDIRENLTDLALAVDDGDADRTYLRLRSLDSALHDLAANARDFHATVAQLRREHDVDPERFLAYKELLLDYLQQFLDHLIAQQNVIARAVLDVEARGVGRLAELAAKGDDSTGLFDDSDRALRWAQRWDGLASWFVGRPGRPAGSDDLIAATTSAISDLLSLLRQLTERTRRPITRASELLVMARWFRRLEHDEQAAELFDAAFGLGATAHLSLGYDDPEEIAPTLSWWSSPPVPVPVTLREYGKRPAPGRTPVAADYSATKARLLREHREAQAARAEAAARLRARPIEGRTLSAAELAMFFELLDRAAHRRRADGTAGPAVMIEGTAAILETHDDGMEVRSVRGTLTLPGHRLVVAPA